MAIPKSAIADFDRRLNNPIHSERPVRVVCVGAGASGLLLAYKLQKHVSAFTLTVYEKNPEVSGTWWENRYPGCACDVPAHNYTWSFEPKLDWSGVYASSKEIFQYFDSFATKHSLKKYIKLQHQVVGAKWNGTGYDITIKDLASGMQVYDHCDVLVNASGILNNWRWPAIPGLDTYKGTLLHTANWDDSVDLRGKHVGVIGNGSSGIQVVPTIQPIAKQVTTFIREPTYVSPVQGLEQHVYSDAEKEEFATKAGKLLDYRRNIERGLNGQFGIFLQDSKINLSTREYMTDQMKQKLANTGLDKQLIPEWSVGCRRLTPGVGYLESLGKENVEVVYGEITAVTERGCLCDDGKEYPVDVLICATGFDTTFKPRFPLIGPDGRNLADVWASNPESYFGIAAAGFPNYLIFLGPNCPIGNGPVLCAIEAQADYMIKMIDHWQTHNIRTFSPSVDAVSDFVAFKDQFMKKTVWADPCRSWYKAGSSQNQITALWPGSALHYIEAMRNVRFDDWSFGHSGNRFAYLGNGHSQTEVDSTADWGYYIRDRDDDLPLSRAGMTKLISKSGSCDNNAGAVSYTGAKL